jgi:hypothetical protein
MGAGRIIAYLTAGLFFVFGALFILGASSAASNNPYGWILTGAIMIGIAFVLIWFAGRLGKKAAQEVNIVQKIDFSGDVQLEKLTCKSCGGALTAENISMLAGAPVVHCPYCKTSYQLEEKPKW